MRNRIKRLIDKHELVANVIDKIDDAFESYSGSVIFPKTSAINIKSIFQMYLDDPIFTTIESKNNKIILNFHIELI